MYEQAMIIQLYRSTGAFGRRATTYLSNAASISDLQWSEAVSAVAELIFAGVQVAESFTLSLLLTPYCLLIEVEVCGVA
ncbi:hypothetical protein K435DRAFT_842683 [Dendrothele bispora CBS 962.96]|uniref:Uncharacterized protein n=1 Tax=Dendrothele bispora (strain CBS 962.96) TaxID=1314807 RepID=A0A4S8LDT5_DENBC|nr:hypothetical protein K435DRAFT_842683 [Dendrothele bispora CBS 962.96]